MRTILLFAMSCFIVSEGLSAPPIHELYRVQKKHSFTSLKHNDIFTVSVQGKDFRTSTISFTVTSPNGELLFTDQFTMDQFKQFGSTERGGDDSAGVMNRLSHFLDEENFSTPAVKDTLEMENNTVPRSVWLEVWQQKGTVGFHYVISTENGKEIAYSRKYRKVILYYKCC